jgi:hypothetical protein
MTFDASSGYPIPTPAADGAIDALTLLRGIGRLIKVTTSRALRELAYAADNLVGSRKTPPVES